MAQVSRETGLNRSLLDKYLRGDSVPGLEQIDRLASHAAHHPVELISDPEKKISVAALLEVRHHIEALARAAGYEWPLSPENLAEILGLPLKKK